MQRSKKRKVVGNLLEAIRMRHIYDNNVYITQCWHEVRKAYKKGLKSHIPTHVMEKVKEAYGR